MGDCKWIPGWSSGEGRTWPAEIRQRGAPAAREDRGKGFTEARGTDFGVLLGRRRVGKESSTASWRTAAAMADCDSVSLTRVKPVVRCAERPAPASVVDDQLQQERARGRRGSSSHVYTFSLRPRVAETTETAMPNVSA